MDFAKTLAWYAHLASQPGWKAYVWQQVQELERAHPAMFSGLPEALKAAMKDKQ